MTFICNRRAVALIAAVSCLAVPGSAAAADSLPVTYRSDAAQAGQSADGPSSASFPPPVFQGGDSPVDHPGAARAPSAAPNTIEVVRPERTIVRDVDEELPLILASTALMLALAGFCVMLIRGRTLRRSH